MVMPAGEESRPSFHTADNAIGGDPCQRRPVAWSGEDTLPRSRGQGKKSEAARLSHRSRRARPIPAGLNPWILPLEVHGSLHGGVVVGIAGLDEVPCGPNSPSLCRRKRLDSSAFEKRTADWTSLRMAQAETF